METCCRVPAARQRARAHNEHYHGITAFFSQRKKSFFFSTKKAFLKKAFFFNKKAFSLNENRQSIT